MKTDLQQLAGAEVAIVGKVQIAKMVVVSHTWARRFLISEVSN